MTAAPVTISLVVGGAITWLLIALPVGILSAMRPRSLLDRTATLFVLIGISVHPVWLGLILSYFLGYRLHVFPITGYCDLWRAHHGTCNGLVQWSWHLVLPWLTFAMLYSKYAAYSLVRALVTGVGAAGAGLFIATAIKLARPLAKKPVTLVFVAGMFLAIGVARVSLINVMPVSLLLAYVAARRALL